MRQNLYIRAMRNRYLFILGAFFIVIGLWTATWFLLANKLRTAAEAALADLRAAGWQINVPALRIGGYPFRLEIHARPVEIVAPSSQAAWQARIEQLDLYWQPWNFRHVILRLDGATELTIAGIDGPIRISHRGDLTQASLVLDEGYRLGRLSIVTRAAHIEADGATYEIAEAEFHARRNPVQVEGPPQINLQIRNLTLSSSNQTPALGRNIDRIEFLGRITGPLRLLEGWHPALAAWREAGGVAEIEGLRLVWGGVDLRAQDATFALDREGRVEGAMQAEIRGYEVGLDAFSAHGLVRQQDVNAAKVGFSIIARRDENGERVVTLPVTAQDGLIYLGPVALTRLAPIFPQ